MIKRPSSRNSRSKGIKGKHVLQICLLVGICFWLIYQVKHSHEKKKEFDEKSEKVSSRAQTHDEILKLGRKDLHPREIDSALSDNHVEEEEDETGIEEEVNKEEEKQKRQAKQEEEEREEEEVTKNEQEEREELEVTKNEQEEREELEVTKNEQEEREEEEVTKNEEEETEDEENTHDEEEKDKLDEKDREEEDEEESKGEEAEDESGGNGDDENDEKNQEKISGETDGEEDSVDVMNERELDGEGKDGVDKEGEDKIGEVEHKTLSDEQEQYDSGKNSHEAREEHYKADDASSAVTHEPEKETSENLIEKTTSELEQENNSTSNNLVHSNNSTSQLRGQRLIGNATPVADSESKDSEIILSNSEDKLANATSTSLTSNQPELTNKSAEVSVDASNNASVGSVETTLGSSQQNDTVAHSHLNQAENGTVDGATTGEVQNLQANDSGQIKSGIISDSNQATPGISTNITSTVPSFESNNTVDGDTSKSSGNSVISDKSSNPDITTGAQINSGSLSTPEDVKDDSHNEYTNKDNESGGADESSGYSTTDGTGDSITHDPIDSSDSSIGQEEREAAFI